MWWLKWSRFLPLFLHAKQAAGIQEAQAVHVLWATFPGEDGTRQVWQVCAQGNHFLWNAVILQNIFWKETTEACLERAEGDANKKKRIFKFPIALHTTSSALQFYEMWCIYILLYTVFLCICFSVRLFYSSAEHVSFHQTLLSSTLFKNGWETTKRYRVLFLFTLEFHQTLPSISILLYNMDM